MKRNKNFSGGDSDDDYMAEEQALGRSNGGRTARRTAVAQTPRSAGRSRPTNNQLLYKAYFRWTHYGHKLRNGTTHLPTETDACPSVTAAFLQVLHTLNLAEGFKVGDQRNILQLLSNNTRRTKVVELSTGTHRVPDELRKHYLSDGEGGQYSTNLDRNRYGNDDQYLFTVIRYDLEFLGLCPCMVDVEIIDAKNDNQSIFVSAGQEACVCTKYPGMLPDPGYAMQQFASRSRGGGIPPLPAGAAADVQLPGVSPGHPVSPKRSGSQVSLAFDALVMAATGGTDGAAAAAGGGEAPVESRLGGPLTAATGLAPAAGSAPGSGNLAAAAAAAAMAASVGRSAGGVHQLPSRQRSRLWSALSYGDVDSLQNALDAFRAEDEIASGPGLSDALAQAGATAAAPQPSTSESYRRRQRKPMRRPSSNNILAQSVDMVATMSGVDRNVLTSLVKGTGVASGLRELSGDNAAQADVVSSGAVQADGTARRTSSQGAGPGRSARSHGGGSTGAAPPPPQQRISFPTGDDDQISHEDDSEPVTDGRSGGRKSGSGVDAAGGGSGGLHELGAAAEAFANGDVPAVVGEAGIADNMLPGAAGEGVGDAGEADTADDDTAGMDGPPLAPLARHVRHVPRQSSAINLATRVGPAELKRMAAEVDALKAENRMLRQAAGAAAAAAGLIGDDDLAAAAAVMGGGGRVAALERQLAALRQQVGDLVRAKRVADDKILQLDQELTQTRNTANQILHHALMKEANAFNPAAAAAAAEYSGPGNGGLVGSPGYGQQGGGSYDPLAALASGQLQHLLAAAHNPAAAALAAAALAAAAGGEGNGVAGFDQQQQHIMRSSGNAAEDLMHFDQQQQLQQMDKQHQQRQYSPQHAAAAAAIATAAADPQPSPQAVDRDMVSESVADADADASPAAAGEGAEMSEDLKTAAELGFQVDESDSKPSSAAAAESPAEANAATPAAANAVIPAAANAATPAANADLAPAGSADGAEDRTTAAAVKQERPALEPAAAAAAAVPAAADGAAAGNDLHQLRPDAAAAAAALFMQQQQQPMLTWQQQQQLPGSQQELRGIENARTC